MATSAGASVRLGEVEFDLRVHVPRSQVWPRSGGRQRGKTHLHVTGKRLDVGRIHRSHGDALCGRRGWFERTPEGEHEIGDLCPRCTEIATRDGASE